MQLLGVKFIKRFVLPVVLISSTVFNTAFAKRGLKRHQIYYSNYLLSQRDRAPKILDEVKKMIIFYGKSLEEISNLIELIKNTESIENNGTNASPKVINYDYLKQEIEALKNHYLEYIGPLNNQNDVADDKLLGFMTPLSLAPLKSLKLIRVFKNVDVFFIGPNKPVSIDYLIEVLQIQFKHMSNILHCNQEFMQNFLMTKIITEGEITTEGGIITEVNVLIALALKLDSLEKLKANVHMGIDFLEKLKEIYSEYSFILIKILNYFTALKNQ